MKNLKLLTGTAVLAGLLLTTGCVKNEETDGVKALRQAQAGLLNAEASAKTVTAEAQAAYDNARAAVEQAKVAIEEAKAEQEAAKAEALRITNALDSATNENEIATLELQLSQAEKQSELALTQIQSQIDLLMVTAQQDLEEAQKDLEINLLDYAAELAEANADNKVLGKYLSLYVAKMTEVSTQRTLILNKNKEIFTAEMKMDTDDDGTPDELLSVVALDIAQKERELAIMTSWKETYVAATNNPDDLAVDSVEAAGMVAELETQIENKDLEIVQATAERDDALTALNDATADVSDALAAYNDAIDDSTTIYDFTYDDPAGDMDVIPAEYLKVILDEPNATADSYYSIEYYDDAIAVAPDAQTEAELEADKAVVVAYINAIQSEYNPTVSAAIEELDNVYFQMQDAQAAAQEAYDAAADALAELNDERSLLMTDKTQAQNYLAAIAADYSALVSNLDDLNEAIENKQGAIATLNNEVASWDDYIAALEEELAVLETELATYQAQAAEYKVLIDEETGSEEEA